MLISVAEISVEAHKIKISDIRTKAQLRLLQRSQDTNFMIQIMQSTVH